MFKLYLENNKNIDAKIKQYFEKRMEPEPEKLKFMQSVLLDRSKLMTLPERTHSLVDFKESDKDK